VSDLDCVTDVRGLEVSNLKGITGFRRAPDFRVTMLMLTLIRGSRQRLPAPGEISERKEEMVRLIIGV
jgi:hypothetical protein